MIAAKKPLTILRAAFHPSQCQVFFFMRCYSWLQSLNFEQLNQLYSLVPRPQPQEGKGLGLSVLITMYQPSAGIQMFPQNLHIIISVLYKPSKKKSSYNNCMHDIVLYTTCIILHSRKKLSGGTTSSR